MPTAWNQLATALGCAKRRVGGRPGFQGLHFRSQNNTEIRHTEVSLGRRVSRLPVSGTRGNLAGGPD